MIDTHAHLIHRSFRRDLSEVLERAWAAGLRAIVVVGYDIESSRAAVQMAAEHERLYAAVGIHPHDAQSADERTLAEIEELAENRKVVAVGETGLDFYRDLSPRGKQEECFLRHIEIAARRDLPVIVHDREAHHDVVRVLEQQGMARATLHCFSGGPELACRAAAMGYFIGVAGPVTFASAPRLEELVRRVPRDRLLAETDCPWLAPEPHRGKRNEPSYVRFVVERVSSLWGVSMGEAGDVLSANALRAFPGLSA
jgi:TatD DNase family protein